jgi:hypothetical protein
MRVYKRDISDGSLPDWCIYRKGNGYLVAKVGWRDANAWVIPFIDPVFGPFASIYEARGCYRVQGGK